MLVIGGSLNTSVGGMDEIVSSRNTAGLLRIAGYQIDSGAGLVSVNAGTRVTTEVEDVLWMAGTIQEKFKVALCFDSSNPEVFKAGLAMHNGSFGRPVIDSVSGNQESLETIIPLAAEHRVPLIGLLMDENGVSDKADGRLAAADRIVAAIRDAGIPDSDLFLDPIVQPVSVQSGSVAVYLETLRALKMRYPEVGVSCGLDNISYGLPAPEMLNMFFLAMIRAMGQDAILVKMTEGVESVITVLETLCGEDPFCTDYLEAYRAGRFDFFGREGFQTTGRRA